MDAISPNIKETMSSLNEISEKYLLPKPYLVGGYVRNLYLGEESIEDDLDFTTNSGPNSLFLGILYAKEKNLNIEIFKQKHASVYHEGRKLDFSSGYISSHLPSQTPNNLLEPMSRDFTIDALHISCDDFSVYDFCGRGVDDVNRKFLDTIIEPNFAFYDDPKRLFRALYLASKYNLKISDRIIESSRTIDIENFRVENSRFITSIVDKSFKSSKEKTIENINLLYLKNKIPLFGEFRNYLIESEEIEEYLEGANE